MRVVQPAFPGAGRDRPAPGTTERGRRATLPPPITTVAGVRLRTARLSGGRLRRPLPLDHSTRRGSWQLRPSASHAPVAQRRDPTRAAHVAELNDTGHVAVAEREELRSMTSLDIQRGMPRRPTSEESALKPRPPPSHRRSRLIEQMGDALPRQAVAARVAERIVGRGFALFAAASPRNWSASAPRPPPSRPPAAGAAPRWSCATSRPSTSRTVPLPGTSDRDRLRRYASAAQMLVHDRPDGRNYTGEGSGVSRGEVTEHIEVGGRPGGRRDDTFGGPPRARARLGSVWPLVDVGIPEEVEHGIRRKWNIDSGGSGTANPGSGTANPEEVEHRFRRKWNSGSGGRERSSVA